LTGCFNTSINQLSLSECSKIIRLRLFLKPQQWSILRCLMTLFITAFLSFSCSPTRRLAEDEYLLNKSVVEINPKDINPAELKPYEKQKPNKTILGLKFHLSLYNLFAPSKQKGIPGWLKEIGEEPVIWDSLLTEKTSVQFSQFLENKGYYNAMVKDSVYKKKKRVNTLYFIELNEPYRIRNISYKFEDQNLSEFVLGDTASCLIRSGSRFDKEVIHLERQRLEELLKNKGYYKFSKEYVFFDANEVPNYKLIDLQIIIKENVTGIPDPETKARIHNRYLIYNTFITPNYSASGDTITPDTIRVDGNTLIYLGGPYVKPEAVIPHNYCTPGSIYNLNNIKKTNSSYTSLGLYRMINIQFREREPSSLDTGGFKSLDCFIELTPRRIHSYQTEIVGTYSSGEIGARASLAYNNYNLLRGAEYLQVRLIGAVESRRLEDNSFSFFKPMKQYGLETTLSFPKFFVPFKAQKFTRKFNPKTLINVSYNFQDRPKQYILIGANTSLSYKWKGNTYNTHQFYPVDFSYVWLPIGIDSLTASYVQGSANEGSFTNHTILSTRYSFEYTTQVIENKEDFIRFKTNIESAGNLLYGVTTLTPTENDSAQFLNVPYFRYLKADIDFRLYDQIAPGNKMVYRIFAGLGYPIGNSKSLPFEKMYTAAGPNDIRAWSLYELGPGTEPANINTSLKKAGDIMLEANLEYRFKLFWLIEGALFVDAGNIWTFNQLKEDGPSTSFKWDKFYDEVAVGAGIGTRLDFSFLMVRFDFAYKMRDPSITTGSKWIDVNRSVNYDFNERFQFQFGIGYPF
jgi:outer membrane protein assembly factor BamA